jgi:hypothetical protein
VTIPFSQENGSPWFFSGRAVDFDLLTVEAVDTVSNALSLSIKNVSS